VLDTGVDHATFGQHHGIRQHGRAIVFGRRGARTDAPRGRPPVGRHSAVPVGRTEAVGRPVGIDTGDCAGDGRPGAQRGSGPAATAPQHAPAPKQQRQQQGRSDFRRDGTLRRRTQIVILGIEAYCICMFFSVCPFYC